MSRYAVKIGEVHIRSDKPITDEMRERAILKLERDGTALISTIDFDVMLTVDGHRDCDGV